MAPKTKAKILVRAGAALDGGDAVVEAEVLQSLSGLSVTKKRAPYSLPSFQRSVTVQRFIQYLVQQKTFSLGHVKRRMHSYLSKLRGRENQFSEMAKADGRDVLSMYHLEPRLFRPGTEPLPEGSHPLQVAVMRRAHRATCSVCSLTPAEQCSTACYFSVLLQCVECGWDPPIDRSRIVQKYDLPKGRNSKAVTLFSASADKEFQDMLDRGVVIPCPTDVRGIVNPLGCVVKNSDKARARTLVGVQVVDQDSLTLASELLVAGGHPKIKARLTTDTTATGINDAALSPPFRYPSLGDGLHIVRRGCVLGKADIGRFFHSFALALNCRDLFTLWHRGQYWQYARCFFGFTACPYYCSTFSAEVKRWLQALGVETAHMMDDFLLAGDTLEEAEHKMGKLIALLESVGFYMAADKLEYGRQLVFLGVLIDTMNMTLRFDKTQSRGMMMQMESYLSVLQSSQNLDHSTVRHVCGKLNWYAEVVQSGRLHIQAWWLYEKHSSQLFERSREQLLTDTKWWIELLKQWSEGESKDVEYKIWSAAELIDDPHSLLIVQSDASGTDGFGYYSGYYSDPELEYKYVSKSWTTPPNGKSHTEELLALEDFLLESQPQSVMLCWVSDSESAVWSVNKGRCAEPDGLAVLTRILCLCDCYRIQLIALWVPREENTLADYLSHYATTSDRSVLRGWLSDLGLSSECSRAAAGPDQSQN